MAPRSTPILYIDASMYAETFQVKVGGEDGKVYTLHKGIASFFSGYFEIALKKDTFKEGRENYVELPEEEPNIFDMFVAWIYGGQALKAEAINEETFNLIVDLYAFADRRDIPLLGNCIVNGIAEAEYVRRHECDIADFNTVCNNTPESCGLRRLLMRLLVGVGPPAVVDLWRKKLEDVELTTEGLWDLAGELAKMNSGFYPDCCSYHVHAEGQSCPPESRPNDDHFMAARERTLYRKPRIRVGR